MNNNPRRSITPHYEKEHPWFSKLDWYDDDQYEHFGHDKTVNHQVTKVNKPKAAHIDRRLKEASALARLVENSRQTLEEGFDQTAMRKDIVNRKSLFRSNIKLKEVMANQNALRASIKGE